MEPESQCKPVERVPGSLSDISIEERVEVCEMSRELVFGSER